MRTAKQYSHAVSVLDCRQAMCDGNCCPALCSSVKGILDHPFRIRVQCRGSLCKQSVTIILYLARRIHLVQQQHFGITKQCPGNRDTFYDTISLVLWHTAVPEARLTLLAARELRTLPSNFSLEATITPHASVNGTPHDLYEAYSGSDWMKSRMFAFRHASSISS